MIKLTQLRLHNTVDHNGQHGRVVQLSEESVTLQYENGDISAPLEEQEITGIELHPRRVEQLGFIFYGESNAHRFIINEDVMLTVNPHISGGYSIQLCVKDHWCGRPVQLQHELENIYLDLTGNELAID